MKKKIMAMTLVAATAMSMFAGCGSSKGAESKKAASSDTVKLTLWASEEDQDLMNGIVDKFEKEHSDTKFDITVGAESESTAKDTVLNDPEAAADVFSFASDQIYDLVKADVLQPVQDTETITSENSEGSVEASTVDGTLYAYPATADNGFFLFYDKNVVSDEDAATWDTILADCEAAGKKVGMTFSSGWYNAGFFYGAGFTTKLNDDGTTTMDWNGTSSTGIKGTDVAQAMLDIAKSPAYLNIADGDSANQIASGQLGAIVSGTWDASAVEEAFGDGYAAATLPTYTCAGQQVEMASCAGYKMFGVNKNSKQVGWAMELAKYITNQENQELRFTERQAGPSNIKAAESDEVKSNLAIATVTEQNGKNGVVQMVGANYWDPTKSFGEILAQGNPDGTDLQTLLDNMVAAVAQPAE